MKPRMHRHQKAYPALWRAVDGAVRDAVFNHPDIAISDRRRASVVKRVVGAVLALQGAGGAAATAPVNADGERVTLSAGGAYTDGASGSAYGVGRAHLPHEDG